jgi:hypothetical protein
MDRPSGNVTIRDQHNSRCDQQASRVTPGTEQSRWVARERRHRSRAADLNRTGSGDQGHGYAVAGREHASGLRRRGHAARVPAPPRHIQTPPATPRQPRRGGWPGRRQSVWLLTSSGGRELPELWLRSGVHQAIAVGSCREPGSAAAATPRRPVGGPTGAGLPTGRCPRCGIPEATAGGSGCLRPGHPAPSPAPDRRWPAAARAGARSWGSGG